MATQKCKKKKKKKKLSAEQFFTFLNASYPKTHLIQSLNSLDSPRPYHIARRLLENQKTGDSKELFLLKNDFQNSSSKIYSKKASRYWRPGN